MSVTLEKRLIDSLRDRAERLGPPTPGLADTVIRRGNMLRRRRRAIAAAACTAVLIAAAAAVLQAMRVDPQRRTDSYATSITLNNLSEGRPSSIPYMIGGTVVDDTGSFDLPWGGLEVRSVWEVTAGYLVEAAGADSTSVFRVRRSGTEVVASHVRGLVVSADGMKYAWEDLGSDPPTVVVTNTYDGEATDFPTLPPGLTVVGFVYNDRGYLWDLLVQPFGGGPIGVWEFGGNNVRATGLSGSVFDATSRNAALATIDGCVAVLDAEWTEAWRDCALVPGKGAVSPNGLHVAAVRSDGSVAVKDVGTGADLGAIGVRDGIVRDLRWEDDDHIVMAVAATGGPDRVVRCQAQSDECEWAGPPPPSSGEEHAQLVLGHATNS